MKLYYFYRDADLRRAGGSPPQYLEPGDVVELRIDGLEKSRQHLKAFHNLKQFKY